MLVVAGEQVAVFNKALQSKAVDDGTVPKWFTTACHAVVTMFFFVAKNNTIFSISEALFWYILYHFIIFLFKVDHFGIVFRTPSSPDAAP